MFILCCLLISAILLCCYINIASCDKTGDSNTEITTQFQCHDRSLSFCRVLSRLFVIASVLTVCIFIALSPVLLHCRLFCCINALVCFVALSLSRPFCRTVALLSVLSHCRYLACFIVVSPALLHCRGIDSDRGKWPKSATIIYRYSLVPLN